MTESEQGAGWHRFGDVERWFDGENWTNDVREAPGPPARPRRDGISLMLWGLLLAVPAGILIGFGLTDPDAEVAVPFGVIFGVVGSTLFSIGIVAQGVIVGMRKSEWEQNQRDA